MRVYEYILTHNGTSETLTVNPAGWDNLGLQFERNWTYLSVLRNMSLSLRFANVSGGGYDFIKTAYETDGINAIVTIQINRRNPATNDFDHYYSGILDFKPKRFVIERNFIEIPIIDNGKLVKFKDRDENEIDLFATKSIDNVDLTPFSKTWSVNMPPIDVVLQAEYENERFAPAFSDSNNFDIIRWATLVDSIVNEVGDDLVVGTTEKVYINNTGSEVTVSIDLVGDLEGNGQYQNFKVDTYNLSHSLRFATYTDLDVEIKNELIDVQTTPMYALSNADYSFSKPINVSKSYTIPAGGYLSIYTRWEFWSVGALNTNISCNDISQFKTKLGVNITGYEETSTKCFFPFEAFTRGLQIVTSETDTSKILDSEVFGRTDSEFTTYSTNGAYAYDAIFSGRMVRQYPDAKFSIKLKDLYNSFKAFYCLGMGFDNVNDRFYIKPATSFFDKDYEMFDLGQVKDLKISPMSEGYFNKILAGFDNKGDYEAVQGAFEFAVNREYSTVTPVKEQMNAESKYRADSVGIEFTRKKQYEINASEDYRDDNAIFIVKTDGTNAIQGGADSGFLGVEKYYNLDKTPRQNVVRNGGLIEPTLYKTDNPIKSQFVAKNFELVVNGKDENSDILKSELGNGLFIPELYEFDSVIDSEMVNILLENPHGYIKFNNFGTTYHGFVYRIETGKSSAKSHNDKASFTLIAKEV